MIICFLKFCLFNNLLISLCFLICIVNLEGLAQYFGTCLMLSSISSGTPQVGVSTRIVSICPDFPNRIVLISPDCPKSIYRVLSYLYLASQLVASDASQPSCQTRAADDIFYCVVKLSSGLKNLEFMIISDLCCLIVHCSNWSSASSFPIAFLRAWGPSKGSTVRRLLTCWELLIILNLVLCMVED